MIEQNSCGDKYKIKYFRGNCIFNSPLSLSCIVFALFIRKNCTKFLEKRAEILIFFYLQISNHKLSYHN